MITNEERVLLSKLFFRAAQLAKIKGLYSPQNRRYLYSLGIYLKKGCDLSNEQLLWGMEKLMDLELFTPNEPMGKLLKRCSMGELSVLPVNLCFESVSYKSKSVEQTMINEIINHKFFKKCKDIAVVCIGSSKVIGDSLGPMVGTLLSGRGFRNIFGSMCNPIDATNVSLYSNTLPVSKDAMIIAIDAIHSYSDSEIGEISIIHAPIKPAEAFRSDLPEIGHLGIGMITTSSKIDCNSRERLKGLFNAPLDMVFTGAVTIANILEKILRLFC